MDYFLTNVTNTCNEEMMDKKSGISVFYSSMGFVKFCFSNLRE